MTLTTPRALGLLVAITLLSSGHRFANDFVFDDVHVIRDGSVIHDPASLPDLWTHHAMFASSGDPGGVQSVDTYRPVPLTLFVLDAQISGRAAWGYHLTNLLLHLACVLGVFFAALLWTEDRWAALYGAAVFAVHPWAVEAHVWINGRSDPASLAFGLLGLIALLQAERRPRPTPWRALATAALLLGLLSKETLLLAFPAILLMPPPEEKTRSRSREARFAAFPKFGGSSRGAKPLSTSRAPRGARASWAGRLVPLGVAAGAYLAARLAVLQSMATHRDSAMLADAAGHLPWLLVDGLRQTVAPSPPYLRSLRDEYASIETWHFVVAALVLGAVAALAVKARRRAPLAAWTALWFFAPIAPVAIISTVLWPGFGRYLYLPLAGFAWLLAALVPHARERLSRPALRVGLATAHVLALGLLCVLFTRDFRDDEALYGAAIAARPDVAMGHGWLGLARLRRGDAAGARPELVQAATLDPRTHRYLINAGRAALRTGDRATATRVAEIGVARFVGEPEEAAYHLLLVNAMSTRDPRTAVSHLVRCLEVWPDRPDCQRALRFLLEDAPDAAENRAVLDSIVAVRPDLREALRALSARRSER